MNITLEVKIAWWLRPYLAALAFVAGAAGREPDWKKLARVLSRAVKVRLPGTREWR